MEVHENVVCLENSSKLVVLECELQAGVVAVDVREISRNHIIKGLG